MAVFDLETSTEVPLGTIGKEGTRPNLMKRLIALISTHGKTPEQVALEAQESLAKYQAAEANALVPSPSESPKK